jgi:hypothetical protein
MAHAVYYPLSKLLFLVALLPSLAFAALTEEEMFFKGVADVNVGELTFLLQAPENPVHHHQNQITLSPSSLLDGWAKLEQCHHHLDAVPDMQIVYGRDRIRNITVLSSANIAKSWVHENTVQMQQVARDAQICISAETRALEINGNNHFSLTNGPYMRRFLDGYYPMQVSMRVIMQAPGLRFFSIAPLPQPGFNVTQKSDEVAYNALFEGELRTKIEFSLAPEHAK